MDDASQTKRPSELVVVADWPGVRSYLPGRDAWVGFPSNSCTVYHRPKPKYAEGEPYVEVTTFNVPRHDDPNRTPFMSAWFLAHQMFNRLVDQRIATAGAGFPMELHLDRYDITFPVNDRTDEFLCFDLGWLWIAGAQLASYAVTVIAAHHRPQQLRLTTVNVTDLRADAPELT